MITVYFRSIVILHWFKFSKMMSTLLSEMPCTFHWIQFSILFASFASKIAFQLNVIWWTCMSETLFFLWCCLKNWFRIDFWSALLHHDTNFAFALSLLMHHYFCIFFRFAFLTITSFAFRWTYCFIRVLILRIFAV